MTREWWRRNITMLEIEQTHPGEFYVTRPRFRANRYCGATVVAGPYDTFDAAYDWAKAHPEEGGLS